MGGTQACCNIESKKAPSPQASEAPIKASKATAKEMEEIVSPKNVQNPKSVESDEPQPLKRQMTRRGAGALQQLMRNSVSKHMENAKGFRKFIQTKFKDPDHAWNELSKDTSLSVGQIVGEQKLYKDAFLKKVSELGFEGNAESIFNVLDENGDGISKAQFFQAFKGKGSKFKEVVEQAVAAAKAANAEGVAVDGEKVNSPEPKSILRKPRDSTTSSPKPSRRGSRDSTEDSTAKKQVLSPKEAKEEKDVVGERRRSRDSSGRKSWDTASMSTTASSPKTLVDEIPSRTKTRRHSDGNAPVPKDATNPSSSAKTANPRRKSV